MKTTKLLALGLAGALLLVGCEKKETIPKLKTGTFSYTDANNNTYSIELTDETITFRDDTLKSFETNETMYVIRKINSEENELLNEGIEMSEDEKSKRINELFEDVDYSIYNGKPLEYTTELLDDDEQCINIYCLDENGNEIIGMMSTYYIKDNKLSFGEVTLTQQN
ncbi:MAG: hypothetical protein PUB97_10485 [Ruminococcus sp.]|nr:hypothetical protein [Ruminococcus sp.]